ncbi:glycoside hydrolase family 3 protein [Conexibacter sp. CPCC 206217]|uniref:glycoside hydrolase family 3 protein n=1 Tax=Conexibacter sp. CPCC 206217 TaxID=3064574 RepID=UPI0027195DE2|nr:glycoside hydrolase family 3 protein [Conexibacter sp. CPCC 206217]MDO8211200.1 glycoside hydrolase family 3 protein [Conexibacter sp. CPCC 206217]
MSVNGTSRRRLATAAAATLATGLVATAFATGAGGAPAGHRDAPDRHDGPGRQHAPRHHPKPPGGGPSAGLPYENARLPVRVRVEDLLSRMTLPEKVGQMTQTERLQVDPDATPITTWYLGSILSGGGSVPEPNTPQAWADMVDRFQRAALATRLRIPLIYGIDAVHGDANMLGATVFPHNIGLGATRDPGLVQEIAHVTAEETRASGPQWTFSPCICAARDDRWGRTYESFSEDPRLVEQYETAIDGYQGRRGQLADRDRVLATAKHYAGDGDTVYGSASGDYRIDQGISITNRQDFWNTSLRQYVPAVKRHDVGSVMPSFSSVDWTEDGVGNPIKMHGNQELIDGLLKQRLGFDGFVVSDWEGIHQLPGEWPEQVRTGVNAGIDMFMEPNAYQSFVTTLIDEVDAGNVSTDRIDDAVRRILTKKFELGLFEHPFVDRTQIDEIGSPAHRALARRAVAESQVLLKNRRGTLPLSARRDVYVAGSNADNIGNQAGGWTLTWQGGSTNVIPGTTILGGIREAVHGADVTFSEDASTPVPSDATGVVVVGETPYAEGFGDVGGPQWAFDPGDRGVPRPVKDMQLSAADRTAVDRVCAAAKRCVVVVVSGRPLILDPAQLDEIDGLVAAWLPGSEGAGVADTLFGRRPFSGRLPMTWPKTLDQEPINVGDADYDPLYPFGWGLRTR